MIPGTILLAGQKPLTVSQFSVALVDDQEEFRTSWGRLINSFPDLCCVCACAGANEAFEVIPGLQPDVVLMDINMPGISGIECTARLCAMLPEIRIVVLSEIEDDEVVFRALQAGAQGYLLKRTKPADLRSAIYDVIQGGAPMTSEIARRVVELFHRRPTLEGETVRLTPREEETLILLSQGHSNKEIAKLLHLSVKTVETYKARVMEKLTLRSRAALVRFALKHGLLDEEKS